MKVESTTHSRGRARRGLFLVLTAAIGLVVLAMLAAWWFARPSLPGPFYTAEVPRHARPGTLIRAEPLGRATPPGARAWRILYVTTGPGGRPAVASAVVMLPIRQQQPAPVVAWAHGTSGIVAGCAPSLFANPYLNTPAVSEMVANGWALVGSDYVGLGVAADGGHAYLVGGDAAPAVLDSVRAARALPGVQLAPQTVVWGHSQGGNTALWAGIIAPDYAPDIALAGVAALAPASDLRSLVRASSGSMFGKIVTSYLVTAYDRRYPDASVLSYVSPRTRLVVGDIAGRCVGGRETLVSVAETMLLPRNGIFERSPLEGPLGARLAQNTPSMPIRAPLFIAQGEADDLVLPRIQRSYVNGRCAAGQPLEYRTYPGRDHVSVLAADSPLTGDLVAWTRARFLGAPATSTCAPRQATEHRPDPASAPPAR